MKRSPPVLLNDTDVGLMVRAAGGDRAAWHALYVRHRGYVYATAYRFLGNDAAARDAAHDVFISLFTHASTYRPTAPFMTYLRRIVVNRCLNERASARTSQRMPWSGAHVANIESPEMRPDEALEEAQMRSAVRAAVGALPPRQRMAVVLSRFEGLTYEQIADALHCSVSSVESLLFRARRNLERALRDPTARFR